MTEQVVQKWTFRRAVFYCLDVVFGLLLRVRPIRSILQRMLLALGWLWAYYTFRIRNKVKIIGRKNLSRKVRVLYVAKHLTLIDSFLIGLAVVGFWESIFYPSHIPWNAPDKHNYLSKPFFRHIFSLLKTVPVVRGSQDAGANTSMVRKFCACAEKSSLVLFPEGGRGPEGEPRDFVDGFVSTIYHAKGVIVVPIFLHNIQNIMPKEGGFSISAIRGGFSGAVVIGSPIDLSDLLETKPLDRDLRKRISDRVREAMIALREQLDAVPA